MNKELIQKKLEEIKSKKGLLNLSEHTALGEHIIIAPVQIEESGVTKRSAQFEDRPDAGLVLSVGPDVSGSLKEGDVVFFNEFSHFKITYDGITYLVLRGEDIVCVAN